jgi:hypothetical protein
VSAKQTYDLLNGAAAAVKDERNVAVTPLLIVGTVINLQCWRRSRLKPLAGSK